MDNQLALIYGNIDISWFAIFVTASCFLGVILACVLRKIQKSMISDIFILVTIAVPIALTLSRIQYCVFSASNFNNTTEMFDLTNGGYGLYGAILGVAVAAFISNALFRMGGTSRLLDCVALGGALAITVGRFATGFTGTEIGYEVNFEVMAVYDANEKIYNLAVYMLDGIFEAIVFIVCLVFFAMNLKCKKAAGKTTLLVLALHGTNQVVMDSLRADALKLGANDFIKISQIIGILCCVAVVVYFMIVAIKAESFKLHHAVSIAVILACIVLGILSEYRVGNGNYISKHILMAVCMIVLSGITVWFGNRAINISRPANVVTDDMNNDENENVIFEAVNANEVLDTVQKA